jgi:exosortase/archaeosortase family protein
MPPILRPPRPPLLAAALAFAGASAATHFRTESAFTLFAGGAAHLVHLGRPGQVTRLPEGWLLAGDPSARPLLITEACSALDFFALLSALIAWRLAAPLRAPLRSALLALIAAIPLTLGINTLRILAVSAAHQWLIPRVPAPYADFLHLLAGVAVFLPALVLLNLVLSPHVPAHTPAPHAA